MKRISTVALNFPMMKELCDRLLPGNRVASFGYPDLISPIPAFEKILGDRFRELEYREDSEAICKRHGIRPQRRIPDAKSFFNLLDAKLDVFDIVQERGDEILCDLNYPVVPRETYDFVLDVGTMEHCFNIAQAAFNMANLLKVGGVILHENPLLMCNHGFYSMNPTWYSDFYGQPGFQLLSCVIRTKDGRIGDVPATKRFVFTETEANLFAIAERTEILPLTFPCQTKYRKPAAEVPGDADAELRARR